MQLKFERARVMLYKKNFIPRPGFALSHFAGEYFGSFDINFEQRGETDIEGDIRDSVARFDADTVSGLRDK